MADRGFGPVVESLPDRIWLRGARTGHRIRYHSLDEEGGRLVGGSVFLPATPPPANGYPLVGWGHCALGLTPLDAPSRGGLLRTERIHLSAWLRAGFAVAATDFRGFEEPGDQPRLDGRSEGRDLVELVGSVLAMGYPLDGRWVCAGFSQGAHAALVAAALAEQHPAGAGLLGTVALAPLFRYSEFFARVTDRGDQQLEQSVLLFLTVLRARFPAFPDFDPDGRREPLLRPYLDLAERLPRREYVPAVRGVTNDRAGLTGLGSLPELVRFARALDFQPGRLAHPLFLAAVDPDEVVPADLLRGLGDALAAAGGSVSYRRYDGVEHVETPVVAAADAVAFGLRLLTGGLTGADLAEPAPKMP